MSRKSSEETRKRILDAAWKLLNSPDEPMRMADVAAAAGVSRQAVYLHFPSRAELLVTTTRYIDEVEDVGGKLATVFAADTGREQLESFVGVWGNYIPVVYGGAKRLLDIRAEDPDAETAWQDRMTGLLAICKRVVDTIAAEDQLADGLSKREATDLLWATVSIGKWELLTIERKVTQKRYLELTLQTLVRTLLAA